MRLLTALFHTPKKIRARGVWLLVGGIMGVILQPFVAASAVTYVSGTPASFCPEAQIVFLIDQSGSMSGKGGSSVANDPHYWRFEGVQAALDLAASASQTWPPQEGVQVSVINFGSRVEAVPQFLGREIVSQNEDEIEVLQDEISQQLSPNTNPKLPVFLGNTNFVAAFQAAVDQLSRRPAGCPSPQRQAIVVLTDGAPWLDEDEAPQYWINGNFSTDAHMAALQEYVQKFYQGDIYVVGLDNARRFWHRMQPYWATIANNPAHVGAVASAGEMGTRVYEIMQEILQGIPKRAGITVQPACDPVEVSPFTAKITFRFFKTTAGDHLTVRDPQRNVVAQDGQPVGGNSKVRVLGKNSYNEEVIIEQPEPGVWSATASNVSSSSRCNVFLEQITWATELKTQQGVAFVQTPIDLWLVTQQGVPSFQNTNAMPQMTAWLTTPSGQRVDLALQGSKNFSYQSSFVPEEAGDYTVQAYMSYQGKDIAGSANKPLKVGVVQVTSPQIVWLHSLTSGMQYPQYQKLLFEFDIVDAQNKHVDLAYPVKAELSVQREQQEETVSFALDKNTQHWQSTYTPLEEGNYTFAYHIVVQPPNATPQTLAEGSWAVSVYHVLPIEVHFPKGHYEPVVDGLYRPKEVIVPFSVSSLDGQPVDVASLTGQKVPFRAELYTAQGKIDTNLDIVQVAPGKYEVHLPSLQIQGYTLRIVPDASLPHGYLWANAPWDWAFTAGVDWRFYLLVAVLVGLFVVVLLCVVAWRARHRGTVVRLQVYQVDEKDGEEPVASWVVRGQQKYLRRQWPTWYWPCPLPLKAPSVKYLSGIQKVELITKHQRGRKIPVVEAKVWVVQKKQPEDLRFIPGSVHTVVAGAMRYRIVREDAYTFD